MVPWGWDAPKSAAKAAEELQRALKAEGAKEVRVEPQSGGMAVRVRASLTAASS